MKEKKPVPKITVSFQGVVVQEMPLTQERTAIGRRPYNAVVMDDPTVSGEHAVLLMKDGSVILEDLGSTNGTRLNGQVLDQRQALHNGDIVEIGGYHVRFTHAGAGGGVGGPAVLRVLTGTNTGREIPLTKVVTTMGKPGVALATVTRRPNGFLLALVEGNYALRLNGITVNKDDPVQLQSGDHITLASTEVEFVQQM